jgi:peptidoglycan L-alanyl-D-glutamate endopeptidase CwlK
MHDISSLAPEAQVIAKKQLEHLDRALQGTGITYRVITWRSHETQNKLFAQGRTEPGKIVTNARPEKSAHCVTKRGGVPWAMGWDVLLIKDGKMLPDDDHLWHLVPGFAKFVGGTKILCGADFKSLKKDMAHSEMAGWKTLCVGGILIEP